MNFFVIRVVFYLVHALTHFGVMRRLLLLMFKSKVTKDLRENHVNILCIRSLGLSVRITRIAQATPDTDDRVSSGFTYMRVMRGWVVLSNPTAPLSSAYRSLRAGDHTFLADGEHYRHYAVSKDSWIIYVIHAPQIGMMDAYS